MLNTGYSPFCFIKLTISATLLESDISNCSSPLASSLCPPTEVFTPAEIFVAQSEDKGGTWSGVIDGLRKKRPIYVRYPEKKEKNANLLLIQKGASAVDFYGNSLTLSPEEKKTPDEIKKEKLDSELIAILNSVEKISVKEIIGRLSLDWKDDKMKRYLDNMQQAEKIKIKNRIYYRLKGKAEIGLFDGQI